MKKQHSAWQVYADVLMCILMWAMMDIALLIISTHIQTAKTDGIKPKAEFLVTLTWDDARNVDLDLWMRDPQGHVIYYNAREDTNISLDRDSRGFATNQTTLPDGSVVYSGNREVITVRAVIPGDYLVAVSYYAGYDAKDNHEYSFTAPDPGAAIDCDVQVEKVNPTLTQVAGAKIHFDKVKESHNAMAFHVDADGSVKILPLPPEDLVQSTSPSSPHPVEPGDQ